MTNTTKQVTLEVLTALGVSMANDFNTSEVKANKAKRETLLKVAIAHSDNAEKTKAILDGYATRLTELGYSDSIVRVRKSEANAVFKAVAKTEVSNDNAKQLQAFEGDYNAFITLARSLVGKKEGSSTPRNRVKTELTENQEKTINESLTKASISQLADIVDTASVQLNKIAAPAIAGLQQLILINSLANNMVNNSQLDDYVIQVAQDIADSSQVSIDRLREAMKASEQAIQATKNNVTVQQELPEATM